MWHENTQMKVCQDQGAKNKHRIYPTPTDSIQNIGGTRGGDHQLGPYEFDANEYLTFTIGLALQGDRPKDWSFAAWGDKGPVYVYADDGKTPSDQFFRSETMKKHEVKGRPKFDKAGLKALDISKQPPQPTLTEKPDPVIPEPPPYDPVPSLRKWVASKTVKPQSYGQSMGSVGWKDGWQAWVAKNTYTKKMDEEGHGNKKVTIYLSLDLNDFGKIP
jgi:hypothetical protein